MWHNSVIRVHTVARLCLQYILLRFESDIVVTWAWMIAWCIPKAPGLQAYISGKSWFPVLDVQCNSSGEADSLNTNTSVYSMDSIMHAWKIWLWFGVVRKIKHYSGIWQNKLTNARISRNIYLNESWVL